MVVASASVACVADVSYDFAAMCEVSFRKAIGVAIKVHVVVNGSVVGIELIDGRPARHLSTPRRERRAGVRARCRRQRDLLGGRIHINMAPVATLLALI